MTVVLVDDTSIVREGLRKIISLNCPQYEVVGEASNGEEGLRLVLEIFPDVCIVDMKMPKMDGVEMVRRVRELNQSTRFIVLSGYADFNYAKSMINYGCLGYLLKPINHGELISLLEVLATERMQSIKGQSEDSEEFSTADRIRIEQEIVRSLCQETHSELDEQLLPQKFRTIVEQQYTVGFFHIDQCHPSISNKKNEEDGIVFKLMDQVHQILRKEPSIDEYCNSLNKFEFMCFIVASLEQSRLNAILDSICQAVKKIHGITLTVGLSGPTLGLLSVNQAFNRAREAFEQCFYKPLGCYHWFADTVPPDEIPLFLQIEQCLFRNLAMENYRGVVEQLRELVVMLEKHQVLKKHVLLILNRLYGTLRKVLSKQNNQLLLDKLPTVAIFEQQLIACERMEMIKQILQHVGTCFLDFEDGDEDGILTKNATLRKVLRYMDSHYQNGLSLAEVAEVVHMTPSYFSTFFKKNTGENYIPFATRMKIERAKELLRDTSIHVYSVSERVGFDDSKYFSRQFHKLTGMTPKQYRDSIVS